MKILLCIFVALLAGCTSMSNQTKWLQAGHAVFMAADSSQTLQAQNAPDCYTEVGWPAAKIIGAHPNESEIVGYQALRYAMRASVAGWLDRKIESDNDDGWRWIRWAWHIGTFALEIDQLWRNDREGLSMFSPGSVPQRCIDARGR